MRPLSLVAVLVAVLSGCASRPPERQELLSLDGLVRSVAQGVVAELGGGPARTVAVSYFTVDGQASGISDYLVGELTTSLATQGKGILKVVSRQLLDRLLSEASFQLSDFADKSSQIRLGKQLGADLILTGFITPLEGRYRLNAQLVEVQSGVVVTGLIRDFRVEGELARKLAPGASETVLVKRERPQITGATTVTTLFEDFDHGPPEIQLEAREEHYGDRVKSASGTVELVEKASVDGSSCARFTFRATLDSEDVVSAWADSGLQFLARISTGQPTQGYDGVSLALKADGFSMGTAYLKQAAPDGDTWFHLDLDVNDGEWQELRIPFASFVPGERGRRLDPKAPLVIEIAVPFLENWTSYSMRTGTSLQAGLSVDNVGFYKVSSPRDARVVESFDDEAQAMPLYAYLYDTSLFTDYSVREEGERKANPGISGQRMHVARKDGGAAGAGRYLSLEAALDLTGKIREFHAGGRSVALFASAPLVADPRGFSGMSFAVRSDLATSGSLELQDAEHEKYYRFEFSVSSFWTRVRIPFPAWIGEQGSVEQALAAGVWPEQPWLQLTFELPPGRLEEAGAAELRFEIGLDDFLYDK